MNNNYEYIIASLPDLEHARTDKAQFDADAIIGQIKDLLNNRDTAVLDLILESYSEGKPDEEFYLKAFDCKCEFVREYFRFDLNVRNAKVEYLNKALNRPEGKDILSIGDPDFDKRAKVDEILALGDILSRERGLDDIMWSRAGELVALHVLDLDIIMSFVVKLKIIDRWMRLNEDTGRELFRKLVDEIRNSKKI